MVENGTQEQIDPQDLQAQECSAVEEMLLAAHGVAASTVKTSASIAPISPYGVGEMIRAAKIEVSALDDYLHKAEVHGPLKNQPEKPCGARALAARRYQSNSIDPSNKKISITSPRLEEAEQTLQNIIAINDKIQEALNTSTEKLTSYKTVAERQAQREPPEISCNQMLQRRKTLKPFAEKYIQQLGYKADSEEAQKILQETVDFYSTSSALADTLRNLVASLEESQAAASG